jgi:uncharacterized membrane protein
METFCGACGARQPVSAPSREGISPRTAAILCYIPILGWIPAVIVLASRRFRHALDLRFHAFQGIYLFVAWLILDWVLGPMMAFPAGRGLHGSFGSPAFPVAFALKTLVFLTWIFMLVKTSQGEMIRLPLLGELADRSVAEQK